MNATEFCFILSKPNAINGKTGNEIDKIVDEFPYFQTARSLQLKAFYNQDSFQYNGALKKTAAYTTDRSVLFEYISTPNFLPFKAKFQQEKANLINEIIVNASEIIELSPQNVQKESVSNTIESVEHTIQKENNLIEDKLQIGKPLKFNQSEKHSFQEWLQLANYKPINRNQNLPAEKDLTPQKRLQIEIIDKFIEANPKITPIDKNSTIVQVSTQNSIDNSMLMTETLAKVYLEQKKYLKAIQAYEILILKYPEKSSFFADLIEDIKILQQNNN
jgi:hypothetical protein